MVILQSRLKMCFNFRQVFDLPADEKSELVNDEHSRMKVRGNFFKVKFLGGDLKLYFLYCFLILKIILKQC